MPWRRCARGSRRSTRCAGDRRRFARSRSGRSPDHRYPRPAVEESRGGSLDALDRGRRDGGRRPRTRIPRPSPPCCFTFDAVLDWTAFGVWMSMLLHRHGDRVLRMKGLLNVAGVPGPVLINGVQHLVHPPAHLERWPDDDRRSRVVVISSGLDHEEIERSLHAFNAIADSAPAGAAANVRDLRNTAPPLRGRARSPAGAGELSAAPSPSAARDSG